MIYDFCILGFGIAGQILLLELLRANISGQQICVIDSHFAGGALATDYGSVVSNTPWWKTRAALEQYPEVSTEAIQQGDSKYHHNECQPVRDIAHLCYKTASTAIRHNNIQCITTTVHQVITGHPHTIYHTFGSIQAKHVFATLGAIEKQLDFGKPTIPLRIALDLHQLYHHVHPHQDHVVVFGTAHSGSILLKHLHNLCIPTTAVYNTPTPFVFARDDEYDGIKEAAAEYADAILAGKFTRTTLVSWADQIQVYKSLQKATKVIYSVGFAARPIQGIPAAYDPATAKLQGVERMYGFGIAYPGTTVYKEKTYTDVSVLSFQQQIQRCLPKILEQQ